MEANRTRRSTAGIVVSEAAYAAFTRPRDSPFHNVSVPLGDATIVERCIPGLDGRRLTAVYPGYACRE